MAKYFYFLCSLLISVSLIILGFTSCSGSNTIATSSSRRTSTSRNTSSSSSDEDDDKDDGDPCKGSDSCEKTCAGMYSLEDVQACEDEGRDKVSRLYKVYKHLKSGTYGELEDISEEDNDVDLDDFEDYLEIGASGWTDLIESWGGSTPDTNKLKDTLEWLIDKTNVAEILQDSDDGLDVLEKILIGFNSVSDFNPTAMNNTPKKNIHVTNGHNAYQKCSTNDVHNYQTGSTNKNDLYILVKGGNYCTGGNVDGSDVPTNTNSAKTIEFDSTQDRILYRGLAYISLDNQTENVFSYAREKNNDSILTMAYDLLNTLCDSTSTNSDKPKACKRALFCWMDIRGLSNSKLDTWIESQSGLDGLDITEDCNPEGFHEFFD